MTGESVYASPDTGRFSNAPRRTNRETSVPYDSGQVYLVFSWVWSMREEGVPHSPTSTWKALGARLSHTEKHIQIFFFFFANNGTSHN